MYQLINESSENVIGIKVSKKLSEKDYETLVPMIEETIERDARPKSCSPKR